MKKVLITGAEGFIGSHLAETLMQEGFDVKAFCLYTANGSKGWLDTFPKNTLDNIEISPGDIRDRNTLYKAMKDCDTVFHLAAHISIPYSYIAPSSFIDTNVNGTLNILQAALDHDIEHLIVTSSSEVYGTAIRVPINEEHRIQPQSPYAASKVAADALAWSFFKSYRLPVTILRPFNTFGPRQSTRAIIPAIIIQLLSKTQMLELGNTTPTRDFTFIDDLVKAFAETGKKPELAGNTYNICSGKEISIHQLAHMLISKINPETSLVTQKERLRPSESEVFRLLGDATKFSERTLWKPETPFERGIDQTIAWFSNKKNQEFYRVNGYQI
ncbi:SDR family NAD(P)-dependent oxidoreductase [Ascidiimonas aurantiaca]|uniref:SDR family NAD(P)-dependent oxidoreductase n=1 Tax=Ascidiimonas aurantiaca TaxID=1685432 RepID=UPI0030EE037D